MTRTKQNTYYRPVYFPAIGFYSCKDKPRGR